jgi:hypothetical protein
MVPFKPMAEEDVLKQCIDIHEAMDKLHDVYYALRRTLSTEMKFRLDEINEAFQKAKGG